MTSFRGFVRLRSEIVPRRLRVAVFDFDGTVSWIRHGWPTLMATTFKETAEAANVIVNDADLDAIIYGMNGKPSIVQATRLADLIEDRGGERPDPEAVRMTFQSRLDAAITERQEQIRCGKASADDYLVAGSKAFLTSAIQRGFECFILSSTVQERVREEAALLGVMELLPEDRVIGSTGDPSAFAKQNEMRRMLEQCGATGAELISFGDGPGEAQAAQALGGLAVAVCTDEDVNPSEVPHPQKSKLLWEAGVDAAIADFRDGAVLLNLWMSP
jgi:phosphoglycolate phosphatase-like HAD superfamily hydrolase